MKYLFWYSGTFTVFGVDSIWDVCYLTSKSLLKPEGQTNIEYIFWSKAMCNTWIKWELKANTWSAYRWKNSAMSGVNSETFNWNGMWSCKNWEIWIVSNTAKFLPVWDKAEWKINKLPGEIGKCIPGVVGLAWPSHSSFSMKDKKSVW